MENNFFITFGGAAIGLLSSLITSHFQNKQNIARLKIEIESQKNIRISQMENENLLRIEERSFQEKKNAYFSLLTAINKCYTSTFSKESIFEADKNLSPVRLMGKDNVSALATKTVNAARHICIKIYAPEKPATYCYDDLIDSFLDSERALAKAMREDMKKYIHSAE